MSVKKNAVFTIDKVTEDSFYANLLLGLQKNLVKCPLITDCLLYRSPPASAIDIHTWEHAKGVILPDELKNFYASTNGFSYTYLFCQDNKCIEKNTFAFDTCVIGKIQVNSLERLTNIYGYVTRNQEKIERLNDSYQIFLSQRSKVFELSTCDLYSKVVLIYVNNETAPSVWLMVRNEGFSYVARNFSTYLRMCIAHLGVPGWHYIYYRPDALPPYSRDILNLLAPGVLPEERAAAVSCDGDSESPVLNKIDPGIFSSSCVSINKNISSTTTSTNTKAPKSRSAKSLKSVSKK